MSAAALCNSCKQPVIWVVTEATENRAARRMPLDADPSNPNKALRVDNGNIMFTRERDGSGSWIVRYVRPGRNLFRSHFATCPNANKHRKGKR